MPVCAFVGLGNMGYPMAGHLLSAGHEVRVFNRTFSRSEIWVEEQGGTAADTPRKAVDGADFAFICVGADDDVRAVVYGDDGLLAGLKPGSIMVDHTTASSNLARELAQACSAKGIGFLDAPISGGQAGAERGTLSIMAGGRAEHFELATPVMKSYGSNMVRIGPVGSGQAAKMVNQILCAGAIQGAAEALAFGQKAGLEMDQVLAAVSKGAAGSWYLSNRGETMVNDKFNFGFAVEWMIKDLGLVQAEASTLGADVPLTEMTSGFMKLAQEAGDGRLDATAIIRQYLKDG